MNVCLEYEKNDYTVKEVERENVEDVHEQNYWENERTEL